MPSVYNYRHVELDKVGRGKRVIQPPGGKTADIFGRSMAEGGSLSSASSQAGSDVASSRVHIETDQQSIASSAVSSERQTPVDGVDRRPTGQISPEGSVASSGMQNQQQSLLMADDFKPIHGDLNVQQAMSIEQQKLLQQQQQLDPSRTPKKSIPVIRRNPITGEIYDNPANRQQPVVRVRQPPGGRSSGIF